MVKDVTWEYFVITLTQERIRNLAELLSPLGLKRTQNCTFWSEDERYFGSDVLAIPRRNASQPFIEVYSCDESKTRQILEGLLRKDGVYLPRSIYAIQDGQVTEKQFSIELKVRA